MIIDRVYVAVFLIFLFTIGCAVAPYHPPQGPEAELFTPAFGTTPAGGGGGDGGEGGDSGEGGEGEGDGGEGEGEGGEF